MSGKVNKFFLNVFINLVFVIDGLGYCFLGFKIINVLVMFGGIGLVVILFVFVWLNIVCICLYCISFVLRVFCILIVCFIFVLGMCIVCIKILFLLSWGINFEFNLLFIYKLLIIKVFVVIIISYLKCSVLVKIGW